MWDYLIKKIAPRKPEGEIPAVHPLHSVGRDGASHGVEEHKIPEATATRGKDYTQKGAHPGLNARGRRALSCPVCHTIMNLERIGDVEVDRCPRCHGVFLDSGEMERLKLGDLSSYEETLPEEDSQEPYLIYTPDGMSHHPDGKEHR